MNARRTPSRRARPGYTLVEVLAASGLIAASIGAAAALSMTMTNQEELARGQAAATRYAEAIARLWQLGINNPATVLLNEPQGIKGSSTWNPMTFTVTAGSPASLGDDAGINEGTVETATIAVTWRPYGSTADSTLSYDVLRPPPGHR